MLLHFFSLNNKNLAVISMSLCLAVLLGGCSDPSLTTDAGKGSESDYIEYNGVKKNKKDLSEDTIQWMEWYQSLPEDEQEALSIIPAEFEPEGSAIMAVSEDTFSTSQARYHYREALSDEELFETEELVRLNYEEANDAEVLEVVPDDFSWYSNKGIEDEYTPGNIIIYRILTTENRLNGNGYLIVSIGRHSKSDPWKIINSGF